MMGQKWSLALCAVVLCAGVFGPVRHARAQVAQQSPGCIYNHYLLKTPKAVCWPQAMQYPTYVHGSVERHIYDAALTFGVPFRLLTHIAMCESSLNPRAVNGDHYGLFQFLWATFKRGNAEMRQFTGVVAHTLWNPRGASYVAAFMFAEDHSFEWQCQ